MPYAKLRFYSGQGSGLMQAIDGFLGSPEISSAMAGWTANGLQMDRLTLLLTPGSNPNYPDWFRVVGFIYDSEQVGPKRFE